MVGNLFRNSRSLLLVGICCFFFHLQGRSQPVDMLESLSSKAQEYYPAQLDSTLHYATLALAWVTEHEIHTPKEEYLNDLIGLTHRRLGNAALAERYFTQAISLSETRGNKQQLANSYNRIGLLYRGIGRIEEAMDVYHKSIALNKAMNNTRNEAKSWLNLGNAYRAIGKNDSALYSYENSIQLRSKTGDVKFLSSALLNMGNWLVEQREFDQALSYYKQYKDINTEVRDTVALALVHSNIGGVYWNQARFDSALLHHFKSIELFKNTGTMNSKQNALNFVGIGNIYEAQGYPTKAITYYNQSLAIYKAFNDPEKTSIVYQNMGKVYGDIGQLDSTLVYYQRALAEAEHIGNPKREAELMHELGVLFNNKGDYEKAIEILQATISVNESIGTPLELGRTNYSLGVSWFRLKKYHQALDYFKQSIQLANQTQDLELQEKGNNALAETYAQLGNYEYAFHHQQTYDALKDSIMSQNRMRTIEELITKYETEKIEANNELLIAQQGENEALIQQRNAENRALLFGLIALTVSILSFITWVVYSNRKKNIIAVQKESLFQNKIDALLNQQQIESVSAVLEGQEKERKRLAAELHDRLGSILSLVKLYFSSMDEDIKQKQPDLYVSFTEGNQFLDDAFKEVRALIKEMKEGTSSEAGLKKDLELLLAKITKLGIEIQSRIELDKKLDTLVELNVFRVIQEALSNSLKYSKAERIELNISDHDQLSMTIRDNGIGFDPIELALTQTKNTQYGVENMEQRVKLMGGDFILHTEKNAGVSIQVQIPLVKNDEVWGITKLN